MTTQIQITENEHGEPCLQIPDDMLDRLGWVEGDEISFEFNEDDLFLKKVDVPTLE
jgi:antitoxin component of MazEF toxin-antitoxin module